MSGGRARSAQNAARVPRGQACGESLGWGPLEEAGASPSCRSPGLCKGYRARRSRDPRTAGCCPTPPTPYTSWTGRSNAISWASWISPRCTGSASGWSTYGRRCATRAGPSPPSAPLATPVASASGWRHTPSDQRPRRSASGQWAHAGNQSSSLAPAAGWAPLACRVSLWPPEGSIP